MLSSSSLRGRTRGGGTTPPFRTCQPSFSSVTLPRPFLPSRLLDLLLLRLRLLPRLPRLLLRLRLLLELLPLARVGLSRLDGYLSSSTSILSSFLNRSFALSLARSFSSRSFSFSFLSASRSRSSFSFSSLTRLSFIFLLSSSSSSSSPGKNFLIPPAFVGREVAAGGSPGGPATCVVLIGANPAFGFGPFGTSTMTLAL